MPTADSTFQTGYEDPDAFRGQGTATPVRVTTPPTSSSLSAFMIEKERLRIEQDVIHGPINTRERLLKYHEYITRKAREVMESKNHDYTANTGDPYANFRMASAVGIHPILGILLRMLDKFKRIQTFVTVGTLLVKSESVEDAIIDLINYSVLAGGLTREAK